MRMTLKIATCLVLTLVWAVPSQAGSVQAHLQVSPPEVLIFTLPGCSYCRQAKDLMSKKHIPFREIDLTSDEGMKMAEAMKIPPMAPVFAYKNRTLQGFTPDRLLKFVEE